ncbi:MAG: glycosyltransferase [Candidatus Competibacter sp.]|nr:glycosyltransferase [Candidatus Competibacter sp.]MDG4583294.1 glycosyltransferase [Candidatus Competibacter sp.]
MITSAHIIGGEAVGGAELFYVRLVNALQARQQPVLAINVAGGQVSARLRPETEQIHVPMRAIWDVWSRWRIAQIMRERRPDIVQTYMGRATRLIGVAADRRPVHIARLGGYYNPRGYRHAHAWVAVSPGIRDHLIRHGFPANRVFHISNFVAPRHPSSAAALRRLRQEQGIPEEALIVTAVGRLHPVKGFDDLLAAFAAVPTTIRNRPIYLIIVGDGPLATELEQRAVQLGVANRVRWPGWRDDAGPFQELADLCVCSSRQEGVGNVVLEAWAYRRPVLSTRARGLQDLITDRQDGWLTPSADPVALAEAMELLLRDESLRHEIASSGHQTLIARHGEEAVVNAYLDLYRHLLG